MRRTTRITVALPLDHLSQVRQIVEGGEFNSPEEVMREALRSWLQRRALHAGLHGAMRLRSFEVHCDVPDVEPFERVELLFDAADAKA